MAVGRRTNVYGVVRILNLEKEHAVTMIGVDSYEVAFTALPPKLAEVNTHGVLG